MKLISFSHDGQMSYGVVVGDGIVDLRRHGHADNLKSALSRLNEIERLIGATQDYKLSEVSFLPPIPDPEKILCVGLNYATHLEETGRAKPGKPMIFTRFPDSQVGHEAALVRPKISECFDFEGELAVIIGKRCRGVSKESAFSVIAGYSCYNDGSIRDWQRHSTQFIPGKNFPKTGSFGPWLVTADEVSDITTSSLTTRLNGEVMQQAKISDLFFGIPELIEYCSAFTELNPGDVIVTGTTGGVGAFRNPPAWMKPGDKLEVEIEQIGVLRNSIVDESE